MTTAYDFTADDIDGQSRALSEFDGKVLLIVNVASKCGFTPQYAGLEQLWRDYRDRGLVVLGFPCDQFGHQEPGDEAQIKEFCSLRISGTALSMRSAVGGMKTLRIWCFAISA